MRHLRGNGHPAIDFFCDPEFCKFRSSLDAEMKRLQSSGKGSNKRQAEPLTPENEELLWEKGLLGDSTPQALLDTMIFYNGICFALQSGDEHRQLRFNSNQIEYVEKSEERPYLKYVEDVSKNRPGGIKRRKIKPTIVYHMLIQPDQSGVLCACTRNKESAGSGDYKGVHWILGQSQRGKAQRVLPTQYRIQRILLTAIKKSYRYMLVYE